MQDSPDSSLENPLFPVARALARSKIGRTFVSLLTLAIFAGLAYFAFHHRDFTAQMVVFLLVVFGLQIAWNCLPFKATTRQRWARKRELWTKHEKMLQAHPAYTWRTFAFIGILNFVCQLWKTNFTALPSSGDLIFDAICISIGLICILLCQRAIRQAEATDAQKV